MIEGQIAWLLNRYYYARRPKYVCSSYVLFKGGGTPTLNLTTIA